MTEKCQQSSYLAETSANCIYTHRTSTSTKPSVVSSVVPSLRAIYASHSHSFFFFSSLCVCYPDLRHPIYVTHLLINYINHIGTICSAPNVLSFFCSLSALLQCFFFNSHILNRIFVSPFGMYHFRTWLCASKRGCTPPTTTMTMLMLMMMFSVLI